MSRQQNGLEPPRATLMGMMMSCDDLPATLPSAAPPRTNRPASTWHSEADSYASAASTVVDHYVTAPAPATTAAADSFPGKAPEDRGSPTKIGNHGGGGGGGGAPRDEKGSVTEEEEERRSEGDDHDEDEVRHPNGHPRHDRGASSPESSPPRGRLGRIVSISGIKRSLSRSDLRSPQDRKGGSRIRSAMSRLSKNSATLWRPRS